MFVWMRKNKTILLFSIIMLFGIILRIWKFGTLPDGINQDEAFAGYETYSLLCYGKDSSNYSFPVYFTTWGSGMNALEIYLMIPFVRLFGLTPFAIRLPQLIVSIFTLLVLYLLTKRIYSDNIALTALFLTAICPWHIMMSRWGLESNLTPGFLMFALYFFVLGTEKPRYFILSSIFYGLTLYCYATIWLIVPIIISIQIIYCLIYKKVYLCKEIVWSFLILLALAFPLFLFLLVNYGLLPEIRTPFLSIPRLAVMRKGEVSLRNISSNFQHFARILFFQSDNYQVNTIPQYGIFYHFTLPLFLIGFICMIVENIKSIRGKSFCPSVFIIINCISPALLGLLISTNLTKINSLFLPMLIITAYGLICIRKKVRPVYDILCVLYIISAVSFTKNYFMDYPKDIVNDFYLGAEDMLTQADTMHKPIKITRKLSYPVALFYTKTNVNDYIASVHYSNYPSPYLDVEQFCNYYFISELTDLDKNFVYLLDDTYDSALFIESGFEITHSEGIYYLAYANERSE